MKFILPLLFLTGIAFSQNHNFSIDNQHIIWRKSFQSDAPISIGLIDKNHPKISIDNSNVGKGRNLNCSCRTSNFAIDFEMPINITFDVEISQTTYIVTISEFEAYYDDEFTSAHRTKFFEKYFLVNKYKEFTDKKNKLKILECLDKYLTNIFLVSGAKILSN